jgi:hypothetical protein
MFRKIATQCLILMFLMVMVSLTHAADIAIIDFADQWTKVSAVGPCLEEMGYQFDDITADVEAGNLELDGYRLLIMSAMYTNSAALHQTVDDNEGAIHDFVEAGGVVIEPTQADQNEANVDWLPDDLICVRSDPDPRDFVIQEPNHPVFNIPNKFTVDGFIGWGLQGWPTGWEVIASQSGFDVLMTEKGTDKPIIMEADSGKGKYVMMCIAPDKYHISGNDDWTKEQSGLFFENMIATWYRSDTTSDVTSSNKLASTWSEIRRGK